MKSLNLALIATSVMIAVSGMAQAGNALEKDSTNHNFMSKRPYQAPLENKAYKADDQWEGTTLRSDEATNESGAVSKQTRNQNQLRLHSLGKRPYMD